MTVREAVEKAYGPVPEGWTIHVAYEDGYGNNIALTYGFGIVTYERNNHNPTGWSESYNKPVGPDISPRPAEAFIGFLGDEYDRVVRGAE